MIYRKHLLALCLVAACSGEQAASSGESAASSPSQAGAPQSADADLADISEYRLTMSKIDRWMQAQRNVAKAAAALSPAERQRFETETDSDANQSMDAMVRQIESNPVVSKAVRDAGLSPREFTTITLSVMQSAMAAAVLKARPNDNQDSLVREMQANMDNIRFMQENEAVLTQKQEALRAELKALDPENDDSGSDDGEAPDDR